MWAAHEQLSLLFIILLIGSQESFRPLTAQVLWMGLFTGCLWRCSERCLNKNYSTGAVCSVWESRTARQRGCCAGKQRHRLDTSPPSGYFTLQNTQRVLWFRSNSTLLKRGEPFNRTPVHSRLGVGDKAHTSHWLGTGRAFAASLGCPRLSAALCWPQYLTFLPCSAVATLLFAACPSIFGWGSSAAHWLLTCCWISLALERSPGLSHRSIPLAPLLRSSTPGSLPTHCALQAKCSPQEVLSICLRTSLSPLIMAPQFLQIRTLYLIK